MVMIQSYLNYARDWKPWLLKALVQTSVALALLPIMMTWVPLELHQLPQVPMQLLEMFTVVRRVSRTTLLHYTNLIMLKLWKNTLQNSQSMLRDILSVLNIIRSIQRGISSALMIIHSILRGTLSVQIIIPSIIVRMSIQITLIMSVYIIITMSMILHTQPPIYPLTHLL